ncbi:MAG: NAD-binding protein, partial [Rhodospirillales bacterium]|nr:NAD-binding protein [Rhodospirillales bacterium]
GPIMSPMGRQGLVNFRSLAHFRSEVSKYKPQEGTMINTPAVIVGEFGNGSKMKFVANHLVHIHNIATAEAMVLGMKAGLAPETIYDVIKVGAGNSRIFELRGPMMVEDNYESATMKMDIWKKDMTVIGDFANSLKCPTPLFTAGTDIYRSALANGMDKLDTAAVCKVLEKMAGLDRSKG